MSGFGRHLEERDTVDAAVLATLVVAAAALRLKGLGSSSLWLDESVTWLWSRGTFADVFHPDTVPPGYNFFAFISQKLLKSSEWSLRLPAAIFGIACVPAAYFLGRLAGRRETGFIAALIVALSPYAVFYSTDARSYSMLALGGTLFILSTAQLVVSPARRWGAAAILSSALLLYSHPFGLLSWAAVAGTGFILVLIGRRGPRQFWLYVVSQALGLLTFAPWGAVLWAQADRIAKAGFWISPVTPRSLYAMLENAAGGWLPLSLLVVATLLLLVPPLRVKAEDGDGAGAAVPLLIAGAAGPFVIALVMSIVGTPILIDRYLSGAVPAWIILAALGLTGLAVRPKGLVAIVAVVGLVFTWGLSTYGRHHAEDYRGVARQLRAELQPDDCIGIPGYGSSPLSFYLDIKRPCVDLYPEKIMKIIAAAKHRLFLVHKGSSSGAGDLIKAAEAAGWSKRAYDYDEVDLTVLTPPTPVT